MAGTGLALLDPSGEAASADDRARTALTDTVARLVATLDAETDLLQRSGPIRLDDYNHRKSRGLLELNRVVKTLTPSALDGESQARLDDLRVRVERNIAALQMHLTAVRDVAALIARAMEDAESDGTYGRRPPAARRR